MKVLAFDVGLVNCSWCLLACDCADVRACLASAQEALDGGRVRVEALELVAFGKKATAFATLCENVVAFVTSQASLLEQVNVCVIETQMTSKMKAISAALYAAVRCRHPSCEVLFQAATAKLSFSDVAAFTGSSLLGSSYSERKRLAVLIVKQLLQGAAAVPDACKRVFFSSKKKDDLADALLHALAALCARSGDAPAGGARKRAPQSRPGAVGARTKRRPSVLEQPSG